MNFKEMIDNMSPEVYVSLKQAVELGKWPNGVRLTQEQSELCLQAIITYDFNNKPEESRVGYIDRGSKQAKFEEDNQDKVDSIKWVDDGPEGNQ
ncbi:YeaC family protein [Marinomonas pollencensis]|uniref:DUF1315 family protein n=1 Tax=Marinomonas pollencensis TaxID=491954 RepID=A0A3E0DTN4_9GAMM|nr:DUF1315 family protein [Marinomonas pollencensis]REG85502.1 hypothetical protein DFP81_10232 [Marinomonas pollencensis]